MGKLLNSKAFRWSKPPTAWSMGYFDRGKEKAEFDGVVHDSKTVKALRQRELAKANTVIGSANSYT